MKTRDRSVRLARRALVALFLAGCAGAASCQSALDIPDYRLDETSTCVDGKCVCKEGRADCDADPSNGCEADLASSDHCGACERTCYGGACAQGACLGYDVSLCDSDVYKFALNGDTVDVYSPDRIYRAPIRSDLALGAARDLYVGRTEGFVTRGGLLYVAHPTGSLLEVPIDAAPKWPGPVALPGTGYTNLLGSVVAGDRCAYVARRDSNKNIIVGVDFETQAVTTIPVGDVYEMIGGGGRAFFTTYAGEVFVIDEPVDPADPAGCGAPRLLFSQPVEVGSIAWDNIARRLYFVVDDPDYTLGTLYRADVTPGAPPAEQVDILQPLPLYLSAWDGALYWSEYYTSGVFARAGGETIRMADEAGFFISVDKERVYWSKTCVIRAIPRD